MKFEKNNSTRYYLITATVVLNIFMVKAVDPWEDTKLPFDDRVNDLVSRLTLDEKIQQLGNYAADISRLGIRGYNYWNEALHGIAFSGLATSFPQAIALSSTWDTGLIFNIASAISDEARVLNNTNGKGLTYWCPVINIARDPRWGRSEENYGEDPYLASKIAVNFIRGMQGTDPKYLKTVATVKHFACNNIEENRYSISSEVDERSLREYYLQTFKTCVTEGKVFSLMSAYNALNGVPCPTNRTLLTHILRSEWGFGGFVVSDCDAVMEVYRSHNYVSTAPEATALSIRNGTDLNCGSTYPSYADSAVINGLISEKEIDTAVKRILKARFLLGEFDPPGMVPYTSIPSSKLDCKANRDLALEAAKEAIVLLKNKNTILPLSKDSVHKIAVIGPNAENVQLGGYSGSPSVSISPVLGIARKIGNYFLNGGIKEAEDFTGQNGVWVENCNEGGRDLGDVSIGSYSEYDSIDFGSGKNKFDVRAASNASGGNIQIVLDSITGTSIGTVSVTGTGDWQNWKTFSYDITNTTGIHNVYLEYSGAQANLFSVNWFRFYNPADTIPPAGKNIINYTAGCAINGGYDQVAIDSAVNLAKKSDVAIVVCGTDLSVASEGHDRSTIVLPGIQEELIKEVFHVNPKTIVVLVTGCSVAINWTKDSIPAILSAWYDGQAQGTAIADVIFGDYNPGGKLSTTWYKSDSDLPSIDNYDVKNNRTYMYFKGTPLFPFGYGLSYTTFAYSNLTLSSNNLYEGQSITVSTDIKNTGKVEGDEVAQMYIHVISLTNKRPIKELKGFSKIHLLPGETKTVSFELKHDALSYYDVNSKTFVVESGKVDILIGASSNDIKLNTQINVTGATVAQTYRQVPFSITEAEDFENKSASVKLAACSNGGQCIDSLINNSYVVYKNMNFTEEAKQFNALLASTNSSGATIQIILDKLNGPLAGTLNILSTGSLNTYNVQSCLLTGVSGVRDVYLVFKTGSSISCRLDRFNFQKTIGEEIKLAKHEDEYQVSIYPNPSSSQVTIKYQLPSLSDVKIEIYTLQGTLIKSIYKNRQDPRVHQLKIVTNDSRMEEGAYIVSFSANAYTKSLLLNLIK